MGREAGEGQQGPRPASNDVYLHGKSKLTQPSLYGFLLHMYLCEEARHRVRLARPGAAAIRLECVCVCVGVCLHLWYCACRN